MNCTFFSFGSRGDSEPLVALALAMQEKGDVIKLITECEEHISVGCEAHLWSEAFPLAGAHRPLSQRSKGWFLKKSLLHFPLILWGSVLLLTHTLSVPFFLLFGLGHRQAAVHRSLLDLPSLIDFKMLIDAIIRRQWQQPTTYSRTALERYFDPLASNYPLPDRMIDFIYHALEKTEIALIAEGADDPVKENIVLFLAGRLGIPCLRVSFFPRRLTSNNAYPDWLIGSSFPALLPFFCGKSYLISVLSHIAMKCLTPILSGVSFVYSQWYWFFNVYILRRRSYLALLNGWLIRQGWPSTTWDEIETSGYDNAMRFNAWSSQVLPDTGAIGFWRHDDTESWKPSLALTAFLDSGQPVIFISRIARSMGFQAILADVLVSVPPCRVVINLPPDTAIPALKARTNVLFIGSVPHSWLLAKVSAAIHHGGAGTTAAVFKAGLPSLVVPTWGDQTLWGQRTHALGVGPLPIHIRWLNAANMRRAINELLTDKAMNERARDLVRQMAGENGLEDTVRRLHEFTQTGLQANPPISQTVNAQCFVNRSTMNHHQHQIFDSLMSPTEAQDMVRLCERFGVYGVAGTQLPPVLDDKKKEYVETDKSIEKEKMTGHSLYFRESFVTMGRLKAPGIETMQHHPRLIDSARNLYGHPVIEPMIIYANMLLGGQQLALHTDVPCFRGADRSKYASWLLVAMHHSGLFDAWRIPIASATTWYQDCGGGEFIFYPNGAHGSAQFIKARYNHAVMLDGDSIFHGISKLTGKGPQTPELTPGMELVFVGDNLWQIRHGDAILATYRWEDMRFSITWKAFCFSDDSARQIWRNHTDDLTQSQIFLTLISDLKRKGRLRPDQLTREKFAETVIHEYVQFPVPL